MLSFVGERGPGLGGVGTPSGPVPIVEIGLTGVLSVGGGAGLGFTGGLGTVVGPGPGSSGGAIVGVGNCGLIGEIFGCGIGSASMSGKVRRTGVVIGAGGNGSG